MTDKRGRLEETPFSYQVSKDNLFIFWEGRRVKILKGKEAKKVAGRLEHATPQDSQLIMAKLTGNFRRGNERG